MRLPTETKIRLKGQTVNASQGTQASNRTLSAGSLGELGSPLYVRHRQGQSLSRKRLLEGHDEATQVILQAGWGQALDSSGCQLVDGSGN